MELSVTTELIPNINTGTEVKENTSICGLGYYLVGDICDVAPPGYVETRNECEQGVDSMEAAGVEMDYLVELEKCRKQ